MCILLMCCKGKCEGRNFGLLFRPKIFIYILPLTPHFLEGRLFLQEWRLVYIVNWVDIFGKRRDWC